MNDSKDQDKLIDFDKHKSPFVHKKKEEKLKKMQKAFKQALPLHKKTKKKKQKNRKKKS